MNIAALQDIAFWTLPPGILEVIRRVGFRLVNMRGLLLSSKNRRFKDIYKGKRCFIVCNGPSINTQDLLPLRDEVVFSVSSGYHHKDYEIFKPRFHCVPQITYTDKWTDDVTVSWFREMHERIGEAELFLSHTEEPLVQRAGLFPGRRINYICLHGPFDKSFNFPDISRITPAVMSVPIMCIMIAMYMGFKEIYLLGTEHDSFISREYKYFFNQTWLQSKSYGVTSDDKIEVPLCDEIFGYYKLFMQYRSLRNIADFQGVSLLNATAGGALDELERVLYEDVIKWSGGP